MYREYRVDVKVRNNLFLSKMEHEGFESLNQFCRLHKINYYSMLNIVNFKIPPLRSDGSWINIISKAAEILQCSPEDFFTETQLHLILKSNKRQILIQEAELKYMLENNQEQKLLEDIVLEDQGNQSIYEALESLTQREQIVIKSRFGLEGGIGETLEDIAEELDVSRERVRQIEKNALRKLRHPARCDKMKEVFSNL